MSTVQAAPDECALFMFCSAWLLCSSAPVSGHSHLAENEQGSSKLVCTQLPEHMHFQVNSCTGDWII